jgi:hypothetical protein
MQYIHSYPPYLEAGSPIRNPRMCRAVVIGDPLNMEPQPSILKKLKFPLLFLFHFRKAPNVVANIFA